MSEDNQENNVITFRGNEPQEKSFECGHKLNDDGYVVDKDGDPMIYICSGCDCRSFRLLSTGGIECCNCDAPVNFNGDKAEQQWRKVSETAPADQTIVPELDESSVNVRAMGDEDFPMRLTLKDIDNWRKDGTLVFVGAYRDDGRGVWWLGARTGEVRDWIVDKIEGIAEHLKMAAYHDDEQSELDLKPKDD